MIRAIYLYQTPAETLMNVFGKLTWQLATEQLNNTLDILQVAQHHLPSFPTPVRTLQSARRRLGVDPDVHIIQYAICPSCWKHYTPELLAQLETPACCERNCTGVIYTLNSEGKRSPILIHPQVSVIGTLRRMFMRPGFAALVERRPENRPGRNKDESFVMNDICDGDMWYRSTTNSMRECGTTGTIRDVPIPGQEMKHLYTHRFGLQLTLNTDWCVFPFMVQ